MQTGNRRYQEESGKVGREGQQNRGGRAACPAQGSGGQDQDNDGAQDRIQDRAQDQSASAFSAGIMV